MAITTTTTTGPVQLTADQRKEAIERLNGSTRMLIDSSNLYRDASRLARNPDVKAELAQLAQDRSDEAVAFQSQVRGLNGEPVTSGGVGGAWSDGLMKTKSLVQNNSLAAVNQVLDSEDGVVNRFNDDLADAQLDAATRAFIKNARDRHLQDRDQLADLKTKLDQHGQSPTPPSADVEAG